MNQYKIVSISLLILIIAFCSGCQMKTPAGGSDQVEPETVISSSQAISESTGTAVEMTAVGVSGKEDSSESISVVSKSDSTIAQAEKKKVLDDISNEIDGLIDEVNKDSSSSDQLE